MKKTMYKTLIALIALVGLSPVTQAQDLPKPEPPRPALRRPAPKPAEEQPAPEKVKRAEARRRELLRNRVGLSEEKTKRVEAIARKHAEQQRTLKQNVRQARVLLRKLLRDDSSDQAAYERALADLETAHRALQQLRQKRFDDLKQTLTPQEQAKLLVTMGKVRRNLRPPARPRPSRQRPQGGEFFDQR